MDQEEQYFEALIALHKGVARQGPGDSNFSEFILDQLPALPVNPVIADIGCGAGAGALMLAKRFQSRVKAVDLSQDFLDQMMQQARQDGLEKLIEPVACDMGKLDWDEASIDLIWSEGAAYILTFEGALKAWRPLVAENGIAVISEMNYFTDDVSEEVTQYMQKLYPDINSEQQNIALIKAAGFEFVSIHRLPEMAWWDNYYDPLRENIKRFKNTSDALMQSVIQETEEEMEFMQKYGGEVGYSFYLMKAN